MRLIVGFIIVTCSTAAFGHARWSLDSKSNTNPRSNATGLKTAPCGDVERTQNNKVFKPGAELKVDWEETIDHPGYFKISISKKDDADFEILVKDFPDTQDNAIVGNTYHKYTDTITLPTYECTGCTLQLIQVMEENPAKPNFYYSCADIELSETGVSKSEKDPDPDPDQKEDSTSNETDLEKPTNLKLKRLK